MADPTRAYPDMEIRRCMKQVKGWSGWLKSDEAYALAALAWKASQGDGLPEELEGLRDVLAEFSYLPIPEAVARVQGLEKAFAEIAEILSYGEPKHSDNDQIRGIVESCVKFSGGFGEELKPGDLTEAVNEMREIVGTDPIDAPGQEATDAET